MNKAYIRREVDRALRRHMTLFEKIMTGFALFIVLVALFFTFVIIGVLYY